MCLVVFACLLGNCGRSPRPLFGLFYLLFVFVFDDGFAQVTRRPVGETQGVYDLSFFFFLFDVIVRSSCEQCVGCWSWWRGPATQALPSRTRCGVNIQEERHELISCRSLFLSTAFPLSFFPVEADLAATSIWPPTYAPVRRADGTERVCKCVCQPTTNCNKHCVCCVRPCTCTGSEFLALTTR